MSLHKLTAGDGYTYLTRQVAAADATSRGFGSLGDYYAQKGESPGEWMGRGLSGLPHFSPEGGVSEAQMKALFGEGRHPDAERIEAQLRAAGHGVPAILAATRLGSPYRVYEGAGEFRRRCAQAFGEYNGVLGVPRDWPVPAEDRAAIRTRIAVEMFREEHGRDPLDDRERSGFLARISRQATTAVAGYDLTFSPVKSVSALWAIAPRAVAEQVEAAHRAAVADVLAWLEDHAAYTRTGTDGVAQEDVTGLIAAAFTHRDSRAGDPDLHTHVAISNKVRNRRDGRWMALDGRLIFANNVPASERYNTRLEAELVDRLGVVFEDRRGAESGKRAVRELVGMDPRLLSAWSTRRQAIDAKRAELAADFQARHGRPPSVVEALALAQQATLATRDRKHEPRSHAEQRATWTGEARQVLGSPDAVAGLVAGVLAGGRTPTRRSRRAEKKWIKKKWVDRTAAQVVDTMAQTRSSWRINHVRAEAQRAARVAGFRLENLDAAVDAVVTAVLSDKHSKPLDIPDPTRDADPPVLRRADGSSVYEVAGTRRYTSETLLIAERSVADAAGRRDSWVIPPEAVEAAIAEAAAAGRPLNPGQAHLVRRLAGTPAPLALGLAPAGTGKTTAMRVLARAAALGGKSMLGLAPSAAAAAVLRADMGTTTDTLAKLLHATTAHAQTGRDLPDWVAAIGKDTMVVLDEAGMASTLDLAALREIVETRGGRVVLIGDDQQLAAIGAGGVLRDIAETHGALTLSQVMRFTDPSEGAASLALRDGDPDAIAYYTDHARIRVGDLAVCTEQAYRAWAGDLAAGRDAIMLAPTLDLVAELNARARADRLARTGGAPGAVVDLVDGCQGGVGDTVITRDNNRRIAFSASDWVKNGDRWQVLEVRPDGGLRVAHLGTGHRVYLPAAYVAASVALGYATTVHAAQGVTADVAHVVAAGAETRQLLYVALTRGRAGNYLYLQTVGDGDPHTVITRDALLPPTAVDVLARILARDGSATSAATTLRQNTDPLRRLGQAGAEYTHALGVAAEGVLGPEGLAALERHAETVLPGLTHAAAWGTLRANLALQAAAGHDPAEVLDAAIAHRELDTALDPAAVLDWRLDPRHLRTDRPGSLPWLPAVPDVLATDPTWAASLPRRSRQVADLAAQVAAAAGQWTPTTAPAWARPLLDTDRHLAADLAVWRSAMGVPDTDPRPTGPPQLAAARAHHQQHLQARIAAVLGDPHAASNRWRRLAETIDPRITTDPTWPALAERLSTAARAGIDIAALATTVGTGRPLPDEQPAAALWWRLARHLPATLAAAADVSTPALRPDWVPVLEAVLGHEAAGRVQADPAWPGLVAAVTTATACGWTPEQALSTAAELLLAGQDDDTTALRPDELATALTWRIGLLIEHQPTADHQVSPRDEDAPPDPDDPPPPDPHDDDLRPDQAWTPAPAADDPTGTVGATGLADLTWQADSGEVDPEDAALARATRAEIEAVAAGLLLPAPPPATPRPIPTSDIPVERIHELNQLALAFFTARYPTSWAADYLRARLGSDLADDPRFTPGYAPAGWRALVGYLRQAGAADEEILAAGLATRAAGGALIDRFRDRLVLPIRTDEGVVGFVARRNPDHDHDTGGERHGPKYLNTGETDAYRKGDHLYGFADAAGALAAGARPVLVEGPIDAIAVTLAGQGRHVGVASLGTALTDAQAELLRPHLGADGNGVIIATDPDPAGRKAAARAYWLLAARRGNPGVLLLPDGVDPADAYARDPDLLRARLADPANLAATLVDDALAAWAPQLDTAEGRVAAMREALTIIGALPPPTALQSAQHLIATLDMLPGTVICELADTVHAWTLDPHGQARRHLSRPGPAAFPAASVRPTPAPLPQPDLQPDPASPDWQAIANAHHPHLLDDPEWPRLAAALDRAHAASRQDGIDVPALFTDHLTDDPPTTRHAWHLRRHLIAAVPAAATPRPRTGPQPTNTTTGHRPPPPPATPPARRAPSARR